jgi:hypothetical protein
MTDMRAGDEDRLPWLEAVEEEEPSSGPSTGKVIGLMLLGLVLLGVVVGGYFWLTQPSATEGDGTLIAAPAEPYKVKPDDPGGMAVEGEGDTAFAASEGEEPQGRIDMSAVPEAPVTAQPPQPKAKAPARPAEEASDIVEREAAPAVGGTIQLGAFSTEAGASSAWKVLSGRFSYLEPLSHQIVPVQTGGRTLYRLRASGPGAANICSRLTVAGESCVRIN